MAAVDLITLEQLKAYMGITDTNSDAVLSALITAASTFAETYCNRTFHETDYANEIYDGPGGRTLMLRNFPVSAVSSVNIDDEEIPLATKVLTEGYTFDSQRVILRGCYLFNMDFANVAISYSAGFTEIPADLQEAIMLMCQYNFKSKNTVGAISRTIAGETLTTAGGGSAGGGAELGLPDRTKAVLDWYAYLVPVLPA